MIEISRGRYKYRKQISRGRTSNRDRYLEKEIRVATRDSYAHTVE
jgi:hypothetical protein